jgi:hypothetical protein
MHIVQKLFTSTDLDPSSHFWHSLCVVRLHWTVTRESSPHVAQATHVVVCQGMYWLVGHSVHSRAATVFWIGPHGAEREKPHAHGVQSTQPACVLMSLRYLPVGHAAHTRSRLMSGLPQPCDSYSPTPHRSRQNLTSRYSLVGTHVPA